MSLIKIESSPISIVDTCYVTSGSSVTFSIISGITSDVHVTYEWYLVRSGLTSLVSISSGYTLTNPETDDEVYLNVINCVASGGIIDVPFYFNDVTPGVPQIYYLDLSASFDYIIMEVVLWCNNNIYDAEIQIDGSPIIWSDLSTTIDISSVIDITKTNTANSVGTGGIVTLVTSSGSDTATVVQGKLRILKTA